MTTIAYKDGVVAYESQQGQGDLIYRLDFNKKRIVNGVVFVLSGGDRAIEETVKAYFGEEHIVVDYYWASGIAIEDGEIFHIGINGKEDWYKSTIDPKSPMSWGRGGRYALGAMDAGATAKEAVKIACGRDIYSGGRIRTYTIPTI